MQPGRLKIVNKWRHRLSYIWSTVDFRQASLQTTEVWKASRDKTRSETCKNFCEMLFIFLLLTGRGVLGRGLSVEPDSFTTHGYTSQVKLTTLNIVNNYSQLEAIILALQQQPSVTLYPNSVVVNLHDGNTSSLYNSQTLWLVQFYSHWSVTILQTIKCHNLNVHLKVWSLPEICPLLAGPCRGHQR